MMNSTTIRFGQRVAISSRPAYRATSRFVSWPGLERRFAARTSRNAALGLLYGVPLSLALWAMIAMAVHIV